VSVEITITWNLIGDEETLGVQHPLHRVTVPPVAGQEQDDSPEWQTFDSVVPLSSSVLAPGLSLPIAAR